MILDYFAENNIRTLVASGRDEMVSRLDDAEVSLVILDLRLGQEDGLDLLRFDEHGKEKQYDRARAFWESRAPRGRAPCRNGHALA